MRMKEHLFDKRVVTRALQEGLLDKEVYQRMLDELPDLSHKVQTAAEAAQQEAASQAAAAAAQPAEQFGYGAPAAQPGQDEHGSGSAGGHPVSDTLEMERPRIPGGYNPDY
jgi:hypothetical protein